MPSARDSTNWKPSVIRFACAIGLAQTILVVLAFLMPNWLERDWRVYGAKFDKLGLWFFCFNSFTDPNHRYPQAFVGCRWLFDEDFWFLRDFLMPAFFVVVQIAYTIATILTILSCLGIVAYWLGTFEEGREGRSLLYIALINFLAGLFSMVAVIVFAIRGDSRDWMPDWRNNYVGWCFVLACIGAYTQLTCACLFLIAGRRLRRQERREVYARSLTVQKDPIHTAIA